MIGGQDVAAEHLAAAGAAHWWRRRTAWGFRRRAAARNRPAATRCVAQRIDVERIEGVGADELRRRVRPARRATGCRAGRAPIRTQASTNLRCAGPSEPSVETDSQNFSSLARAPSRPPSARPEAKTAAFIAPALAPLIAPISIALVFDQRVEDAPGVGAVRAAALKREIDDLDGASGSEPWPGQGSRRRPAAVDREIGAGDLRGGVRAEIDGERGDLVDGDELLGRLRRQHHVVDDLLRASCGAPSSCRGSGSRPAASRRSRARCNWR